jgi:hypothetical protein
VVNEPGRSVIPATIELVDDADPPEGRLIAHGSIYEFHGWLGLALALEGAIDATRHSSTPGGRPPTRPAG